MGKFTHVLTQSEAAKRAGVSVDSVQQAKRIRKAGAPEDLTPSHSV